MGKQNRAQQLDKQRNNFGTMFHFSPSFKPNSLIEPQWFPRDITDTVESQLDQLERLEEARRQRLGSVANGAATTPIGLHDSSASSDSRVANAVPGPNNRRNLYSQYRYYPPPPQASSSSNHAADGAIAPPSTATSSTRRRHYRTAARTRSSNASEAAAAPTSSDDTTNNNLSHLSHSHISHDRSSMDSIRGIGTSFSVSSPLFNSPPLDPRGGGGGGRRNNNHWYAQQLLVSRQNPIREESQTTTPHVSSTPRNFALFDSPENPDMITPEDQGVTNTPGHGNTEDVYSQRRRRRRREMDA